MRPAKNQGSSSPTLSSFLLPNSTFPWGKAVLANPTSLTPTKREILVPILTQQCFTSDTKCRGFSCTNQFSTLQTPPAVLQFNSDTTDLELVQIPHRFKGSVPQDCPSSNTSHRYWIPRLPTLPSNLADKSGVPMTPLPVRITCYNDSWNSGKHLLLPVYYKGYDKGCKWIDTRRGT